MFVWIFSELVLELLGLIVWMNGNKELVGFKYIE